MRYDVCLSPCTTLRCYEWQLLMWAFHVQVLVDVLVKDWDQESWGGLRRSDPEADCYMQWAWHRSMSERLEGGLSGSVLEALKWFPTFKYLDCVSLCVSLQSSHGGQRERKWGKNRRVQRGKERKSFWRRNTKAQRNRERKGGELRLKWCLQNFVKIGPIVCFSSCQLCSLPSPPAGTQGV